MPMETNVSQTTGIRPISQPSGPQAPVRPVAVRSPFAPETNVDIKNSVSNLTEILSQIATDRDEAAEEMAPEIKNLINNIMRQSFSVSNTLGEGLGSTVESQRFAVEQLTTLSRILNQLGNLSRQSQLGELDGSITTLLQNFKRFVTSQENALEPVLLHKLAYELLDTKEVTSLPPELLALFMAVPTKEASSAPQNNESAFAFLKQLVQYFMPATPREEAAQAANNKGMGNQAGQEETANGKTENTDGGQNRPQTEMSGSRAESVNNGQNTAQAQNNKNNPWGESTQKNTSDGKPALSQEEKAGNTTEGQNNQSTAPANAAGTAARGNNASALPNQNSQENQSAANGQTNQSSQETQSGQTAAFSQTGQTPNSLKAETNAKEANNANQNDNSSAAQNGSETTKSTPRDITGRQVAPSEDPTVALTRRSLQSMAERRSQSQNPGQSLANMTQQAFFRQPPLENTSRTMEAMRGLAELLTRDAKLSEADEKLLLQFVNGEEEVFSEKDAKQLNLLLRLCQKNLPASIQQAAFQHNLPGLPRLWAFMQLCDVATLREKQAKRLRETGRNIGELANSIRESMTGETKMTQAGQRTMHFMLPLYMGENQKSYPTYVSVYDEEKEGEEGEPKERETWLRICVLTEHIGAVELTCRLYEKQKLDVRLFFSASSTVNAFRDYIPEFIHSFDDSPLELVGLKLGVAKAK